MSINGSQSVWESEFELEGRVQSKLEKVCNPLSAVSSGDIMRFLFFFLGFRRGGSALGIGAARISPSSRSSFEVAFDTERVKRLGSKLVQCGSEVASSSSKSKLH